MERTPPPYIELSFDDDENADTFVNTPAAFDPWADERTLPLDFDAPALSPEAKLVAGYLTMEEHGMFAELPLEEQERVVRNLRS